MRPFRDDDLNSYAAMMDTPELRESLRIPDGKGRPEAWLEMAWWRGQWELRGTGNWALEDKESGTLIGRAGLHNPEREDCQGLKLAGHFIQTNGAWATLRKPEQSLLVCIRRSRRGLSLQYHSAG